MTFLQIYLAFWKINGIFFMFVSDIYSIRKMTTTDQSLHRPNVIFQFNSFSYKTKCILRSFRRVNCSKKPNYHLLSYNRIHLGKHECNLINRFSKEKRTGKKRGNVLCRCRTCDLLRVKQM